jgi:hypothetical protein
MKICNSNHRSSRVCACIDSCKGEYTNPVPFTTEQCEPDRPTPPKLLGSRLKNSLTLKWPAAADNGSKILNYILEYDEVRLNSLQSKIIIIFFFL